ncbi:T9SS type A sorting domain-containing protein [Gelidibacter gilvus]|uniref:T9SS type A sorting domain-containing protein n=1 Tax=Gelidibacter gilvus TaxID=59602 RepID=A0A4Q0XCH8_9FLAO|nr:T9SS type A sorting domain-containing protein [Gelidibacter gilvus]RXJ44454.1 T9SS type A sorting domain-containing protein [Gelidibacter gilvus]
MRLIYLLITLASCQISLGQKGLYIAPEAYLNTENSVITIVDGDFVNASNSTLNGGFLQMKGLDTQPHRLILKDENTLDYLQLYDTSVVELDGQLVLNKEILFLDTSKFEMTSDSHVTLGPTAEIVGEFDDNTIIGADGTYIKTTRNHTAGVGNDFGLIGVHVTNGTTSMESTEIYRRYGIFDINGNPTVKRYYEINPTVNEALDINARFYLSDVDLNGLERTSLAAFRSTDNGTTFTNEGGTPSTYFHLVEHIDSFSLWTFADASTLAIESIGDLNNSITIAPNPANYTVNITSNLGNVINAIELFTLSGQKMDTNLNTDNTFDVRSLADGIYILKIISQHGLVTKKLIVKR